MGIALVGSSAPPSGSGGIYLGNPGMGGSGVSGGTNPNCTGATGADGVGGGAGPYVNLDHPANNVLSSGQALAQGQSRTSANGVYVLTLQTDSNFCFYKSDTYQWCSIQAGLGGGEEAVMQTDGNLCLRTNGNNTACTNTTVHPGAYLWVRDDGHAVIYDGSVALWTIP